MMSEEKISSLTARGRGRDNNTSQFSKKTLEKIKSLKEELHFDDFLIFPPFVIFLTKTYYFTSYNLEDIKEKIRKRNFRIYKFEADLTGRDRAYIFLKIFAVHRSITKFNSGLFFIDNCDKIYKKTDEWRRRFCEDEGSELLGS